MKLFSFLLKILVIYSFFSCDHLLAQNVSSYINALNKTLYPVELNPENLPVPNLIPGNLLKDKEVIGLGESTHGTKEYNLLRSQLIKDQILNNNVRIVSFETDYCSSEVLNKYMQSDKKDSLLQYVYKSGLYGLFQTQENYDLLAWIKEFNLKQIKENRIVILGIDMQDPYSISKKLLEEIPTLKYEDSISYNKLKKLNQIYSHFKEVKFTDEERTDFKGLVPKLKSYIKSRSILQDTTLLSQYITLLSQTLTLRDYPGFFTKEDEFYTNLRDKFMSDNAMWLYKTYSNVGKMIIWAHNGHISHAKLEGSYRMGFHLKKLLNDKYYALGTLFDEGSVRIFDFKGIRKYKSFYYSTSTKKSSAEYILKQCDIPNFFIDLNKAQDNPILKSFFKSNNFIRVIGAEYHANADKDFYKNPLLDCFDGLVFFRKANAALNISIKK